MATLLIDSPWRLRPLQPFAGAGIGVARNTMDPITRNTFFGDTLVARQTPGGSNTGFAWQAPAVLALPITANLTAELAYRYVDLGKLETSTGIAIYTYGPLVAVRPLPRVSMAICAARKPCLPCAGRSEK